MAKWEETVISPEEIADAKGEPEFHDLADFKVAERQAEISFKAGEKAKLEELVEWFRDYWTGLGSYNIPLRDYQSFLKSQCKDYPELLEKWGVK